MAPLEIPKVVKASDIAAKQEDVAIRKNIFELRTAIDRANQILEALDQQSQGEVPQAIKSQMAGLVEYANALINGTKITDHQVDLERVAILVKAKQFLQILPEIDPQISPEQKQFFKDASKFVTKSLTNEKFRRSEEFEKQMSELNARIETMAVAMESREGSSTVNHGKTTRSLTSDMTLTDKRADQMPELSSLSFREAKKSDSGEHQFIFNNLPLGRPQFSEERRVALEDLDRGEQLYFEAMQKKIQESKY